jgi:hypothetical protein
MNEQLESLPDIVSKNKLEDELDELRANDLPVSNLVSEISEESGAE